MPKLKVTTSRSHEIPSGTKIIRNDDDFVTLAKKRPNGVIMFFTSESDGIDSIDLLNDSNWIEITQDEILEIVRVFNIK